MVKYAAVEYFFCETEHRKTSGDFNKREETPRPYVLEAEIYLKNKALAEIKLYGRKKLSNYH